MKKILQEFKQFAMRGNVIDMAVGIIIGGAFGKIVSSVVGDIIMPAIGLLIGGVNFTDLKIVLKQAVMDGDKVVSPAVSINYGNFLQVTFDFIIIAFSIFMLVKGINALNKKKEGYCFDISFRQPISINKIISQAPFPSSGTYVPIERKAVHLR